MIETEAAKERRSIRRVQQLAEDDSELSFHSASADTDYGANDSLFLAAIEAEGGYDVLSISSKGEKGHRSSPMEEFFDVRSSFTVA